MQDDTIAGGIERAGADRLEGWCWSPARPGARLTVEILLDDVKVAEVVASLFRRDLAREGVGDGRHAFVWHAPDGTMRAQLDGAGMIALRERATSKLVGSLRQRRADETSAEDARLAHLQEQLAPSRRAAFGVPRAMPARRMRAALAGLGDVLAARADCDPFGDTPIDPLALAAQNLMRTLAPIALPIVVHPRITLVLFASADVTRTYAAIAALSPALARGDVELVVADDGAAPSTPLLATLVGNLSFARSPPGFASSANAGAAAGRADWLTFLHADGPLTPSPHRIVAPVRAGTVVLGCDARAAAVRCGVLAMLAPEEWPGADDAGVILAVGRGVFEQAGGFDPSLVEAPAVCALDFALKAAMLGARTFALARAEAAGDAAVAPGPEFRARWRPVRMLDGASSSL